jgi:hypothetical protein
MGIEVTRCGSKVIRRARLARKVKSNLARLRNWVAAAVLLPAILGSSLALGQSVKNPSPTGRQTPVPLPHLYGHFLIEQDHLDRAAAQLEKQGKSGAWVRDHYQKKLGFTDAEYAPVRESAQRLETELNAIDAKVQKTVAAVRAAHSRVVRSPSELPPVLPELFTLRDQHEAVIQQEVVSLKAELGPKRAAKLDTFLQNEFAPKITRQVVTPPPIGYGAKHPIHSLLKGVRQ